MIRVVGVRFKKAGKVYYFDPAEYPIAAGAKVVVETARGVEYGEVAVGPKEVADDQVVQPLKKVLRVGTDKDAVVAAENKRKENEAFGIAQKKIEAHGLEMNLVDVEYTFDGSKVIFYFTAEGRIDFRELVRDLASVFRTRIEMRQIGVRDEAKLLGGIGPCGRILCCTSFLGDFAPVSIRMAKDQNLSLNPSKISGLCGRLMCCLRYEQETYEAAKKDPTLAPGYVPPVMLEEAVPNLDELEDRPPTPAIGIRMPSREGGMSARIAQAAAVAERPQRRDERPAEPRRERPAQGAERRPAPPARPQGQPATKALPGEKLQGEKLQGQAPEPRRERPAQGQQPRPQQSGNQPQGERQRQQGQPRRERPAQGQQARPQQGGNQPQGERQRQQGQPQGRNPERQPRPNQAPPQGARAQGGAEPAEGGNKEHQRSRNHRHRRRGGGGGQGGQNPQGGGNPPA